MPFVLAAGEIVRNWLTGIAIVMSTMTAVGVAWLMTKARRAETVEGRLHDLATKLIDERFRSMTHELHGNVQSFVLTLEELKVRLRESDSGFRGLGERDQKIELTLAEKMDQLKDYIRDTAATKKDLEAHETTMERKVERIETQVTDLSKSVAVLNDRMKA